ncbi:MAG: glyoxalase [Alphaproteobacteria bacterium]|nr:glyoxalase [Alphaproteobacteria bacterium]
MIAIAAIDHVQVAIPRGGEAVARGFYRDFLGLPEIAKPEPLARRGGFWLQARGFQIHVGIDDDFHPATKAHPAFRAAGVMALLARARAAGYEARRDDELADVERIFLFDPFGNRLEFIESPA